MDIYDRINEILKREKKSKRELSNILQMPYSSLNSLFQRRSTSVDVTTMKKIATYLNTTLEYLVTGNEEYFYLKPESNNFTVIAIRNENEKRYFTFTEDDFNVVVALLEKIKKG